MDPEDSGYKIAPNGEVDESYPKRLQKTCNRDVRIALTLEADEDDDLKVFQAGADDRIADRKSIPAEAAAGFAIANGIPQNDGSTRARGVRTLRFWQLVKRRDHARPAAGGTRTSARFTTPTASSSATAPSVAAVRKSDRGTVSRDLSCSRLSRPLDAALREGLVADGRCIAHHT